MIDFILYQNVHEYVPDRDSIGDCVDTVSREDSDVNEVTTSPGSALRRQEVKKSTVK